MKNVTYMLGAGASALSLPTTGTIAKDLENLVRKDNNEIESLINKVSADHRDAAARKLPWLGGRYGEPFTAQLPVLAKIASDHPSLDTYARMINLQTGRLDSPELVTFKASIACYLLLQQIIRPVDQRYELLFASILERHDKKYRARVPQNVRILTWNYDVQLEKAFRGFTNDEQSVVDEITHGGKILRLNGSCIPEHARETDVVTAVCGPFNEGTIDYLNRLHGEMTNGKLQPGIRFAWENEDMNDAISAFVVDTQVLVVMGYSFPYFNREIDRLILSIMKIASLETVYVQSAGDEAEVIERIQTRLRESSSPRVVHVVPTAAATQFFIPNEIEDSPFSAPAASPP